MSEQELETEQPESMHDALSNAFGEETTETVAQPVIPVETGEVEAPAGAIEDKDAGNANLSEGDQAAQAEAQALLKPPQSWGVAEREGWAAIDPVIQTQINKRESEIQTALTNSGEARHFQDEFKQAVAPFLGFIQAEGGTPMSAFTGLMETAATLQAGAPQQKASRMAELIEHYGIDIPTLDTILSGQTPQQGANADLANMLDQRLAPMQNFMQQQHYSQQQQQFEAQQQTGNEITQFLAQHEFAKDVRSEMADMMEMAGKRGETMTLDQSYERALMLRPDIQQVIEQRKAATAAAENNRQVQGKRSASVSVPQGAPASGGQPNKPANMRAALEDAWDN